MKGREKPALEFRCKVDKQIPAAKEIQSGERRVLDHILGGKDDHFPDLFFDAKAGLFLAEKPSQPLRRDIDPDIGRVDTGTGGRDRILVNIRTVYLDLVLLFGFIHKLPEEDGNGIGLLTGGASGHPDSKAVIVRFLLKQLRQDFLLQYFKGLRIPEKAGDVDQKLLEQEMHLLGVLLQKTGIGVRVFNGVDGHPSFDPASDGGLLVEGKIMAGSGP